jgi:hypothetical protein
MGTLLWILAVLLIVVGVVRVIQESHLWGAVLIVLGLLLAAFGPAFVIR